MTKTKHKVAYAFDLGGSALKFALVTPEGRIIDRGSVPTGSAGRMAGVREAIREASARLREMAQVHGARPTCVGAGCAGTLAGAHGTLVTPSPNLPFMKGFQLAGFLSRELGVPAVAENDATVAALGEFRCGSGRGKDSLLMATIGTGLGGGLVVAGELVRGRFGTAAEIGHGVFQPDGLPCPCGSHGCLEQYTASRALIRYYQEERRHSGRPEPAALLPATVIREIIDRAQGGERAARKAVACVARNLGIGLATCASLVPVDVIAIGGGLSSLGPILLKPVREAFDAHALPYVRKAVRIVRAKLGNRAGVVGAALLGFEYGSRRPR